MPEPGFTPEALAGRVAGLAKAPALLAAAARAARAEGRADAASRLADLVECRMPSNGGRGANGAAGGIAA